MIKKLIVKKCSLYNLYFLFFIIMFFVNLFIKSEILKGKIIELILNFDFENSYFLPYKMLILYIQCLGDFLAIIVYFIIKKLGRQRVQWIDSLRPEGVISTDNLSLDDDDNKKSESQKKKTKIILFCTFISVLDFLKKFSLILYNIIYPDNFLIIYTFSFTVPFETNIQFILSYFILKRHFYKLQYLSLFINIGIFLIILSIDIFNAVKNNEILGLDGNAFYFFAFNNIFLTLEFSLLKKILAEEIISIYSIMSIKGVIVSIFSIIFSIILYYAKRDFEFFSRLLFLLKGTKYTFLAIANIFSSFLENVFAWLIIDKFAPDYYPLMLILQQFILVIMIKLKEIDDDREKWDLAVRIILYIFSLCCVIMHNEIVVLNVCNLASDTKYFFDLQIINEELYPDIDDVDVINEDLGIEIKD